MKYSTDYTINGTPDTNSLWTDVNLPKHFHGTIHFLLGVFFIVLTLDQSSVSAQQPLSDTLQQRELSSRLKVGVLGNGALVTHEAAFQSLPNVANCCEQFTGGSSLGFLGGGILELRIFEQTNFLKLQLRGTFSSLPGKFTEQSIIGNALRNGAVVDAVSEHRLTSSLTLLSAEPIIVLEPLPFSLQVFGGLSIGTLLSSTFEQEEALIFPLGATYSNGSLLRNQISGDIPETPSLFLSVVGGLRYDIDISSRLSIAPEISYQHYLNPVVTDSTWNLQAIRFGVSLMYSFTSRPKQIPPPEVIPEKTEPETTPESTEEKTITQSSLPEAEEGGAPASQPVGNTINIEPEFFTQTNNGERRVLRALVLVRENNKHIMAMPQTIPISQKQSLNDNMFAGVQQQKLLSSQASAFVLDSFTSEASAYKNYWNILGKRMQDNADVQLSVQIRVPEGTNQRSSLSYTIARELRQYLRTTWNIPENRIRLSEQRTAQNNEEVASVNLSAGNGNTSMEDILFAPIEFTQNNRSMYPQEFFLEPGIRTSESVQGWYADFLAGNVSVGAVQRSDAITPLRVDVSKLNISQTASSPKSLDVMVGVETRRIRDRSIIAELRLTESTQQQREQTVVTLRLPSINPLQGMQRADVQRMLKTVAQSISSSSVVEIQADRSNTCSTEIVHNVSQRITQYLQQETDIESDNIISPANTTADITLGFPDQSSLSVTSMECTFRIIIR